MSFIASASGETVTGSSGSIELIPSDRVNPLKEDSTEFRDSVFPAPSRSTHTSHSNLQAPIQYPYFNSIHSVRLQVQLASSFSQSQDKILRLIFSNLHPVATEDKVLSRAHIEALKQFMQHLSWEFESLSSSFYFTTLVTSGAMRQSHETC